MHEVLKSLPNQNDEIRSNVNRLTRHRGERSNSDKTGNSPGDRSK